DDLLEQRAGGCFILGASRRDSLLQKILNLTIRFLRRHVIPPSEILASQGVQAGKRVSSFCVVSRCSPEPSARATYSSYQAVSRLELKAIHAPSGDQAGSRS